MTTIDTEENLVSDNVNFESEKTAEGKMENNDRANNASFYSENFVNNVESYNTVRTREDIEVMNGLKSLTLNQKKNIASLLQLLEKSIEIFESTCNRYNSIKNKFGFSSRHILHDISHHLKKVSASMEKAKSTLSIIKDDHALVYDHIRSIFPIDTEQVVNALENIERVTFHICSLLSNVEELCRLILNEDPSFVRFLFLMPVY